MGSLFVGVLLGFAASHQFGEIKVSAFNEKGESSTITLSQALAALDHNSATREGQIYAGEVEIGKMLVKCISNTTSSAVVL